MGAGWDTGPATTISASTQTSANPPSTGPFYPSAIYAHSYVAYEFSLQFTKRYTFYIKKKDIVSVKENAVERKSVKI